MEKAKNSPAENLQVTGLNIKNLQPDEGYEILGENGNQLFTITLLGDENGSDFNSNNFPFTKYASWKWVNPKGELRKKLTAYEIEYCNEASQGSNFPDFNKWLNTHSKEEARSMGAALDEERSLQQKRIAHYRLTFPKGYQILLPEFFTFNTSNILQELSSRDDLKDLAVLCDKISLPNVIIQVAEDSPDCLQIGHWENIKTQDIDRPTIPVAPEGQFMVPEGEDGSFEFITPQGYQVVGMTQRELGKSKYKLCNEDNIGALILPDGSLLVLIADGMGGHARGEIAAALGVKTMIEYKGTLKQRFDEAMARINILGIYSRLYDSHYYRLPAAALRALHISNDHVESITYGDCEYCAIEGIGIVGGAYPDITSIEDLNNRSAMADQESNTQEDIPKGSTIVMASDGAINDIVFEELVELLKNKTLEEALAAIKQRITDFNLAEKREWHFPPALPVKFYTARDNASMVLIRRLPAATTDRDKSLAILNDKTKAPSSPWQIQAGIFEKLWKILVQWSA